jgi:hypothetical protein
MLTAMWIPPVSQEPPKSKQLWGLESAQFALCCSVSGHSSTGHGLQLLP